MMKTTKLNLNKRSYDIIVGRNIIKSLGRCVAKLKIGSDAYVITNKSVRDRYGASLHKRLRQSGFKVMFGIVPDSEKSKSITTAFR